MSPTWTPHVRVSPSAAALFPLFSLFFSLLPSFLSLCALQQEAARATAGWCSRRRRLPGGGARAQGDASSPPSPSPSCDRRWRRGCGHHHRESVGDGGARLRPAGEAGVRQRGGDGDDATTRTLSRPLPLPPPPPPKNPHPAIPFTTPTRQLHMLHGARQAGTPTD